MEVAVLCTILGLRLAQRMEQRRATGHVRACPAAQSQSLRSGLAFNKMPPGPQLKCTRLFRAHAS